MKDVIEQLKKDPGSVKWGGGSRGSTEHIAAAMIAREVGVDPAKINYVAFRGAARPPPPSWVATSPSAAAATASLRNTLPPARCALCGRHVFRTPQGRQRAYAQGAGHQRGHRQLARRVRRPGITAEQRKALIDALSKTFKHKAWQDAMEKNGWTPAWLAGDEFSNFVDSEFASLRATMAKSGMI